jgi:hypothetical protein
VNEPTDATEVQTGTRAAAVLLIKAAAVAVGDLDNDTTTEAEAAAGMVAIGHAANLASVYALLAIEERLGELVAQQRIANALIGTGHMGVINSDAEIRPARDAVRKLLGLTEKSPA